MHSESIARRSTSALLDDDNEKLIDAITDQQPLLGYTDLEDNSQPKSWYHRVYARHGLYNFIY